MWGCLCEGLTVCGVGVQIWDLRQVSLTATLQPFDSPATTISWDFSGKFLVCTAASPALCVCRVLALPARRRGRCEPRHPHHARSPAAAAQNVPPIPASAMAWTEVHGAWCVCVSVLSPVLAG